MSMAANPTPTIVSGEAIEKAVNALLKWKDSKPQKPQLLSSDDFVYLVVTLRKIPPISRTNPYKIPLAHPLYSDGADFCLFLDDRPDRLPTSKDAKAKIAAESIPLQKVIKLSKLKTDYKPFEAKRKLCDSYDMFLADRRIVPLLPKHLGKQFFKKKKIPVPLDLEHKNWKEQVERVCSSAFLHLKTGTCSTLRVARSSMSVGEISENVLAAINGVSEIVPKKWRNVRSLHLKLSDSVALPVYQSLPEADLIPSEKEETATVVDVVVEGKKRGREEGDDDALSSKKSPKSSSKKGRIHQVRYMDDQNDAADGEEVEKVVEPKKSKTKKETISKANSSKSKNKKDGVDAAVKEEAVEAPKKSSKTRKGKSELVEETIVAAPKKSAKAKKEASKAELVEETVVAAPKKSAKAKKEASKAELVEETIVAAPKKSAKAKKEASKAELTEVVGAKAKKSKKVEAGLTDGAKTKKADKVRKVSGDAKTGSAKKTKRS